MTFANPAFLWAFAGLSIPVAIHLLSRKEGKIIRVGSIRHVEESNTSQFKSIRLNEIFLLLLRCLMISAIVLLMSGAQCSGRRTENKIAFIERGIKPSPSISEGYELRDMPQGNHWLFAEDLNKMPDSVIVISHSYLKDFNGERVALNDNINWITAEPTSNEYEALAWNDSVRIGISNSTVTKYQTKVGAPDSIQVMKPPVVNVVSEDKIVIAALNVLKNEYKLPINFSDGQKIVVTPSIGPFVERISPSEIHINKKLDQDVALNENLVIELFKVLYPELQKTEVDKDARVLPDEISFSKTKTGIVNATSSQGLEKYLLLFFGLTLAAERFVAIRRNQ